jgi:hypothetical protein
MHMTGAEPDEVWPLIKRYHYSKRMPSAPMHTFAVRKPGGLFGDFGDPVAAAIYGNPVNKYLTDGAIELLRLVRHPDYATQLSGFVAWSLRWLRANTDHSVCVSYADSAERHHGGIYQACGFLYCGEKGVPFDKVAGFKDASGKFWHARSVNARFGTHKKTTILERFPDWSVVEAQPKHFYIKPLRRKLKPLLHRYGWTILEYPKPNAACPVDEQPPGCASAVQPREAAPLSLDEKAGLK